MQRLAVLCCAAALHGASGAVEHRRGMVALEVPHDGAVVVPEIYIAVLKASAGADDVARLRTEYADVLVSEVDMGLEFRAFTLRLTDDALAQLRAAHHDAFEYVEHDTEAEGAALGLLTCPNTQTRSVTWGLDRLTSTTRYGDSTFKYNPAWGSGVDVYVVDSGVRCSHEQLRGRCRWGSNHIRGTPNYDEHGHGTHIAGTIAGSVYGVARSASVIAVKVLDKDNRGSLSNFISGLNWVINQAGRSPRPSVVNYSIGGGYSRSHNAAIAAVVRKGIQVAISAMNDNRDACNVSPASEGTSIVVGSVGDGDKRSGFSNWGRCLDLFAMGGDVLSLSHRGDRRTAWMSGTSMAAPHVVGAMAAYLSQDPTATPAELKAYILRTAQRGLVRDTRGSPNVLLHLPCRAGPPPPTPTPPTPAPPTPTPPTPVPPTPVPGADYLTLRDDDGQAFSGARFGFLSDGYAAYPPNTDVAVTLEGVCRLRWVSFDLEASENNCEWDHVIVASEGVSQKYCGGGLPADATYSGFVTVTLHSDEAVQRSGFEVEFQCEEETPTPVPVTPAPVTPQPVEPTPEPVTPAPVTPEPVEPTPEPVTPAPVTPEPVAVTPAPATAPWLTLRNDGGSTVRATVGTISDGWATYPKDTRRAVTVRGASCAIRFTDFSLEASENDCEWDFVEVLSGGASLGKFCGGVLPGPLLASGNSFTVVLRSDEAVVASGFSLNFECAAPAPLTLRDDNGATVDAAATTGRLSDGWVTYPTAPEDQDWAEWSVTVRGASCVLQFTSFDVEEYTDCAYDHVELLGLDGASLGKFCGSALPPAVMAGGDGFTVVLRSDAGVAGSGFFLDFACL